MSETKAPPDVVTNGEKKGLEEVVRNLRCELRSLYESLAEKNEQMLLMERDVRERDASIKFLRSEFQKVREQNSTTHTNQLPPPRKIVENGCADVSETNEELLRKLKAHDALIKELSEKCIRLTHDMTYVQRKSFAKDDRIRELQNEIDKFRQVVRPLTQAMFERKRSDSYDEWASGGLSPGVESTRVLPLNEPRMKRQAISAEPLSALAGMEGELVKIPKSSL